MNRDFNQIEWDDLLEEDCRQLVRLAVREELEREQDWTTLATVPPDRLGAADIVPRQNGIVAGMKAVTVALDEMAAGLDFEAFTEDSLPIAAGARMARLHGKVRDLLTCERIVLNLLGRLMGIATLTAKYVEQTAGTAAQIYDTRKTTPGWRRLEKHAVRCGGGRNHRTGLFDAILIKDNHIAQLAEAGQTPVEAAVAAVRRARQFLATPGAADRSLAELIIEIEVDGLDQLRAVLPERPDIVLLDNMSLDELREAVELRDALAPGVALEASGGVRLETVRAIAATGVDRISVGALTHSASSLDVGLDWHAR